MNLRHQTQPYTITRLKTTTRVLPSSRLVGKNESQSSNSAVYNNPAEDHNHQASSEGCISTSKPPKRTVSIIGELEAPSKHEPLNLPVPEELLPSVKADTKHWLELEDD